MVKLHYFRDRIKGKEEFFYCELDYMIDWIEISCSYQKYQFWLALALELLVCILWSFGTFYGHMVKFYVHLVYFTAIYICRILWSLVFSPFWYIVPREIWQP
jgi:hypothetical protein